MGAEVSIRDIDIAHRVSFRDTSRMGPKPIVCKFIRRLARNEVMSKRKEGRSVDPSTIGLHEGNVLLLDHLTPRLQQLYSDAKEFKLKYGYQFFWREMDLSSFVIQRMKVLSCWKFALRETLLDTPKTNKGS